VESRSRKVQRLREEFGGLGLAGYNALAYVLGPNYGSHPTLAGSAVDDTGLFPIGRAARCSRGRSG
jgi:hypothetical protein